MGKILSDHTLEELSSFLSLQIGLYFPRQRWSDLERGMANAAREFGFADAESCARRIMESPLSRHQVEVLAAHLTVQETYFYREPTTLRVTQNTILPELVRQRRGKDQRLRFWSAGCSSGEEAYTLAIMLTRMLPDLADWNITILATDINPHAIKKALAGVYSGWSFRGTPAWVKELFFRPAPQGRFEIVPKIRQMVTFAYLNLAEDSYPSLATNTNAMDLIFCRNVLMYFEQQLVSQVVEKLHKSLVDGGWLVVSPKEAAQPAFSRFQSVSFPEASLYRKVETPAATPCFLSEAVEERSWWAPRATQPPPPPSAGPEPPAQLEPHAAPATPDLLASASSLYRAGRYADAVALLLGSMEGTGRPEQGYSLLVRSYANEGALDKALHWCDKALRAHKLTPEFHYLRAVILQERDDMQGARDSLKRALYLDPNLVLAHFALGNLALAEGKGKEEKHFANALALLNELPPDALLPESEGMTASRLAEVIRSMLGR